MKLLNCEVENFGAYKNLAFSFNDLGLALIYGPTGAGKSTLMDVAAWILFAQTAKGGSVEEVKSWQAEGRPTKGWIEVAVRGNEVLRVTRIRGTPGSNDLYWAAQDGREIRGKDLIDTQKLLENRLGISADTFLAGSYFHEFSETASFFSAPAKAKRLFCDRLADLTLPTTIAAGCQSARKAQAAALKEIQAKSVQLKEKILALDTFRSTSVIKMTRWEQDAFAQITQLKAKVEIEQTEKANKIQRLEAKIVELKVQVIAPSVIEQEIAHARNESRCSTCGALPPNVSELLERVVEKKVNNNNTIQTLKRYQQELKALRAIHDTYAEQLTSKLNSENPFVAQVEALNNELVAVKDLSHVTLLAYMEAQRRASLLEHLADLAFQLRAKLLVKAVEDIERQTNVYLDTYFDAEIRVSLTLDGEDKLAVVLQKSGYECAYTQLSKGQRQLLRLCFSVAAMKAITNNYGIELDTIMLDEPTDGCDVNLKTKAFRLFEALAKEHGSVLVIEHSQELQSLFNSRYQVKLVNDHSVIQYES